jgi:glyceraldehyde-3-phosphate dehydrogenase/erythrose-4-phosphate dehydrogenase
VGKVIKHLEGKLDGVAFRVPTPVVSIVDFICLVKKPTSVDIINYAYKKASGGGLKGILAVSDEGLVSSDFKGNPASAIVDLPLTMVKDNMVKVVGWYDNEWGYSNRLVELSEFIGK